MTPFYHAVQLPLFTFATCTKCHAEKAIVDFPVDCSKKNGHRKSCSVCWNAQERAQTTRTREKHNAYKHMQRARNPEHNRVIYQRAHLNRRGHRLAQNREWTQSNPLKKREIRNRRRARKSEATVSSVSYKRILARDGYWCYICEKAIDPTILNGPGKLTFDHVHSLACGGAHSEDNIKPAHFICNCRKKNRFLEEMTPFQRCGLD